MAEFSWGTFDDGFVADLRDWIGGRRVLEVFAGNGLLAAKLAALGVDVHATSILSGHDGHRAAMYHQVEELDAESAVLRYRGERDILLMAWPVVSEAALKAALRWGAEKPIAYIGEVTDLAVGQLGGCASDLFFEFTEEVSTFPSYTGRGGYDRAGVRRTLPAGLERFPGYR